jgi:hypothetical protein
VTQFTKYALACLIAGGLAAPAYADSTNGEAPSDQSTGAVMQNPSSGQGGDQNAANNPGNAGQGSMNSGANSMNGGRNGMGADQRSMQVSSRLRQDLSKAGFTDISLMPTSFLVRAKDSQGNPVMMVINPDSISAMTTSTNGQQSEMNSNANSASGANHNTPNSAGASPGPSSTGGSQPVTPGMQKEQP